MKIESRTLLTALAVLTFAAGTVSAWGGGGTSRSSVSLKITATAWGPSDAQYEAARKRILESSEVKSELSGSRYRLLDFSAIERADEFKNSLPPTHYRGLIYDYTNDRPIIVEGDFEGKESLRIEETDLLPDVGATNEEIQEGFEIIKSDPVLGPRVKAGTAVLFEAMPGVTFKDGERLVNVGIRDVEKGADEIVGISYKNSKVVDYGTDAPPTGITGGNCGIPNSGQGSSSSGSGMVTVTSQINSETVWEMLVVRPAISSGSPSEGSGIEIRDVRYKGKSVLRRGHAPVLNVKYHNNVCGPYRDWQDSEGYFDAPEAGSQNPMDGYRVLAEGQVAKTAVESGSDTGNFRGVAVYQQDVGMGTELVLVTEMNAGWYRYIMEWRFAPDGTIRPRYGFGSVSSGCVCAARDHHVYWRFDFDIVGSNNDVFKMERGRRFRTSIDAESKIFRSYQMNRSILIKNSNGNEAYMLVPNITDEEAYFRLPNGSTETYGSGDIWVLQFSGSPSSPGELNDPNTSSQANIDAWLTGQPLGNNDAVVWYGAHQFRNDATSLTNFDRTGQVLDGVHTVGPDLRAVQW